MKEVLIMMFLLFSILYSQKSDAVREPAVAGMFYPAEPETLQAMIREFLSHTEKVIQGDIGGLVSPHAGYIYSGPVAAWSYRQIEGNSYDVVVVIAPSHFEYFRGASVFPGAYYETPLGKIPVDHTLAEQLAEQSPHIHLSMSGHSISFTGRGEHSLEVQLPFLQTVLKDFKLLPIVIADQSWDNVKTLALSLANVLKGKKALIVASSDLSHYHPYTTAYTLDEKIQELFNSFDYQGIVEGCERHEIEACGYGPIATMMYACELLGYNKSKVLKYATSGDVPVGEKAQVVGYMSGVVYR